MGMRDMLVYRDITKLHEDIRLRVMKHIPAMYRLTDCLTIECCFDGLRDCLSFCSRSRDNKQKVMAIDAAMKHIDALYYKIELQSLSHIISLDTATNIFLRISEIEKQLMGLRKHLVSGPESALSREAERAE